MTQLSDFLPFRSSLAFLNSEGVIETSDLSIRKGGGHAIALSRQRCVFTFFQAAAGLGAGPLKRAAQVFAEAASPFKESGYVLCRHDQGYGIWWWDRAWVSKWIAQEGLDTNILVLPETALMQPGSGPRIIRSGGGYEAQYWQGDALLGSRWMRDQFSPADWSEFMRPLTGQADPTLMPALTTAPLAIQNSYLRTVIDARLPAEIGAYSAMFAIVILISITTFFIGQTISAHHRLNEIELQISELQRSENPMAAEKLRQNLSALRSAAHQLDRPSPLFQMQMAQELLVPYKYKLTNFESDGSEIKFSLPQEAASGVDIIAAEFEESPHFQNVEPSYDKVQKRVVFRMKYQG